MITFALYHHPAHGKELIKKGFAWAGLFFGVIWTLYKQMWWLALLLLLILGGSMYLAIPTLGPLKGVLMALAIQIPFNLLIALKGNAWHIADLKRKGYQWKEDVVSNDIFEALQQTDRAELKAERHYQSKWYKQFWPWFIVALLGTSVTLGTSLLVIATKNPPSLIADNYYDVGKGINTSLERENLARQLQLEALLVLNPDTGSATLTLTGFSKPNILEMNILSPTQPEKDRRVVLTHRGDGIYEGLMQDFPAGRRFIELLGSENEQQWRLYGEEQVVPNETIVLGD